MRGGMFVGMGAPINPGAFERPAVSGSVPVDSATGGEVHDPFSTGGGSSSTITGGKRRTRKGKKGGKRKSKKVSRRSRARRASRKMRGGADVYGVTGGVVNAGSVGYGYAGAQEGVTGGIAPAGGYPANVGGAPISVAGVRSA